MNRIFCYVCLFCLSLSTYAEKIENIEKGFRSELDQLRREFNFPGATAAFVLPDGRFGEVAVGAADCKTGRAMTVRHRMLAASIGKTFVSAVALSLAAEGRLDLDAPISGILGKETWFPRLPQGKSITARHLLAHRSGLPNHVHQNDFGEALRNRWMEYDKPFTARELIGFVLDKRPLFKPGEGWAYSDTGYILLGMVLERVCCHSLYDEVNRRFLKPLNLKNTSPSNQRSLPGLATGYTYAENSFGFPEESINAEGRLRWNPAIENFGGGWVSTAGDLARWGAVLYSDDILPSQACMELRHTYPVSKSDDTLRYGYGVSRHTGGPFGPALGHGGWIPGYVSSLRYYIDKGLTVAFQINTDKIDADGDWMSDMEIRLARSLLSCLQSKESCNHE